MNNNNTDDTNGNVGWIPWSKHVLLELQRLNENDKELEEKLESLKSEMNRRFTEIREDYLVTKEGIRIKNQRNSMISGLIAGGIISLIVTVVAAEIMNSRNDEKIKRVTDDVEMLMPGHTRGMIINQDTATWPKK